MGQRWAGAAGARAAPLQFSLLSARDARPGWDVRISRRARRLSMRIFPGGRVEVVVPPGVGVPAIERFVARHRDWAERQSREFGLPAPEDAEVRPAEVELAAEDLRNVARSDGKPSLSMGIIPQSTANVLDVEVPAAPASLALLVDGSGSMRIGYASKFKG